MPQLRILLVLATSLTLISCYSTDEAATQGSKPPEAMTRPPDLITIPDTADEPVVLPEIGSVSPDTVGEPVVLPEIGSASPDTVGEPVVLPEIGSASIRRENGQNSLTIDATPNIVWKILVRFWISKGIELAELHPEIGLMETDWFANLDSESSPGSGGAITNLFKSFIAQYTIQNKFRLQLEKNEAGGVDLFITHYWREKMATDEIGSGSDRTTIYNWVEQEEDPEKVTELLRALAPLFSLPATGAATAVDAPDNGDITEDAAGDAAAGGDPY